MYQDFYAVLISYSLFLIKHTCITTAEPSVEIQNNIKMENFILSIVNSLVHHSDNNLNLNHLHKFTISTIKILATENLIQFDSLQNFYWPLQYYRMTSENNQSLIEHHSVNILNLALKFTKFQFNSVSINFYCDIDPVELDHLSKIGLYNKYEHLCSYCFIYCYDFFIQSSKSKNFDDNENSAAIVKSMTRMAIIFVPHQKFQKISSKTLSRNLNMWTEISTPEVTNSESEFVEHLHKIYKVLHTKWSNFQGENLTIATKEFSSTQIEEIERGEKYNAVFVFYQGLFSTLNATPFYDSDFDDAVGVYDEKSQRWTGVVGQLLESDILFSGGVSLSADRHSVIKFSKVYWIDHADFITGLPKQITNNLSLTFLFNPFTIQVWLCVLIIILLLWVIVYSVSSMTIVDLHWLLNPLIEQNFNLNLVAELKGKNKNYASFIMLIISAWLCTTIALNIGYKSKFVSSLIQPTIIDPPNTFSELVQQKDYVLGTDRLNTPLFSGFRNMAKNNHTVGIQVLERIITYFNPYEGVESIYKCFTNILDMKKFACIHWGKILDIVAAVRLVSSEGKRLYKHANDQLFQLLIGLGLPKDRTHLQVALDKIIGRFLDGGFISYWIEKATDFRIREGKDWAREQESIKKNSTATRSIFLTLQPHMWAQHLKGPIFLMTLVQTANLYS